MFYDHNLAEIRIFPGVYIYIITDNQHTQEEWCNVYLAYCVKNGGFFTTQLTFSQISAMLQLKLVAYYTTSFVREMAFSFRIYYTNVPSTVLTLNLLAPTTVGACINP